MKDEAAAMSAVILTLNEETNLAKCVESLRWCKRVCVVDSGSTDNTKRVATTLGLDFYEHKQQPPFLIDRQRNWALENCGFAAGEWVLFLDADETIPERLKSVLSEIASRPDSSSEPNAYEMAPRFLFWGRWLRRTNGFPNWHPRLMRVGQVVLTGGVWEEFVDGARISRIKEPYDHHANSKGFADWLERHDRYSSWDAHGIIRFLETQSEDSFETGRKTRQRAWSAKLWPLRPVTRFAYMYFWRRGFMEGKEGLVFCLSMACYEWMTVVKVAELLRKKRGLPL